MYFKMTYENGKFGSLFNDAFSVTRLHSVDDNSYVNDELKGLGKKRSWTNFKVLSRYSPGGTEESNETLNQDSRSPGPRI
jgi:hypothetical protein